MSPFFYKEEPGAKGLPPLSHAPPIPAEPPPLRFGQYRLTIPNTYSTITCHRRCAPTAVHLRSGMPFGFPPESMFTFTGILT